MIELSEYLSNRTPYGWKGQEVPWFYGNSGTGVAIPLFADRPLEHTPNGIYSCLINGERGLLSIRSNWDVEKSTYLGIVLEGNTYIIDRLRARYEEEKAREAEEAERETT